jgi:hypothetical protein
VVAAAAEVISAGNQLAENQSARKSVSQNGQFQFAQTRRTAMTSISVILPFSTVQRTYPS